MVARDADMGRGSGESGGGGRGVAGPCAPRGGGGTLAGRAPREARGDTISIAQKYNTSVAAVRQVNKIRGTVIKVGQRLTIDVPRGAQAD